MSERDAPGPLVQLRARVDAHFAAAVERTPDAFACRPGCAQCCHQLFSVFEVEAAPIRAGLAALPEAVRARVQAQGEDPALEHCALLVDSECAVYDQRPLICRSHGLPIAVADEAAPDGPLRVDHCPLNFVDEPPPRPSVLVLDAVNRPLAVLAEMSAPGAARVDLAALARQRGPLP